MAHIEISGEALCKCGRRYSIRNYDLSSTRTCVCGLKSTLQQCTCGDIIIIYESATHKHVTCGNCGRTIRGKPVEEKSTEEVVGGADESEYIDPIRRSQPIELGPAYDPYAYLHTHRRIVAESASGPVYGGQKKSTCWGGNKKR